MPAGDRGARYDDVLFRDPGCKTESTIENGLTTKADKLDEMCT